MQPDYAPSEFTDWCQRMLYWDRFVGMWGTIGYQFNWDWVIGDRKIQWYK